VAKLHRRTGDNDDIDEVGDGGWDVSGAVNARKHQKKKMGWTLLSPYLVKTAGEPK